MGQGRESQRYVRHDINPAAVTVPNGHVLVQDDLMYIRAAGLAVGQEIPIEVNVGVNSDLHWAPYTHCGVAVVLSSTNSQVILFDNGMYRVNASALPVGAIIVSATQNATIPTENKVYARNVNECPNGSASTGGSVDLTTVEANLSTIISLLTAAGPDYETQLMCAPGLGGGQVLVVYNPTTQAFTYVNFPSGTPYTGSVAALETCKDDRVVNLLTQIRNQEVVFVRVLCDPNTSQKVAIFYRPSLLGYEYYEYPTWNIYSGVPASLIECDAATKRHVSTAGTEATPPNALLDLQALCVVKTSSIGTVQIDMSDGSVYILTNVNEIFTQSSSDNSAKIGVLASSEVVNYLPQQSITALGGATFKWHGLRYN
jgi:hypothetical protein